MTDVVLLVRRLNTYHSVSLEYDPVRHVVTGTHACPRHQTPLCFMSIDEALAYVRTLCTMFIHDPSFGKECDVVSRYAPNVTVPILRDAVLIEQIVYTNLNQTRMLANLSGAQSRV